MFWHGRPFGNKLQKSILINLYKAILWSTAIFYLQLTNGYSAVHPVDHTLYAFYNVSMTTLGTGFYILWTSDVPYRKYSGREHLLPFQMSRLYLSCKLRAKNFIPDYLKMLL